MMKNTTVIYVQMIRSLCIQLLQEMDTDNINLIQKTARIVLLETNVQRVRTWQKLSNVTYGKSWYKYYRSVILWNGKKFIHREKKPLNEYLRTVKKTMDYDSQGWCGLKKNQQNAWLIFACHNLEENVLRGKCRKKAIKKFNISFKIYKKTISFRKIAYIQ